MTDTEPSATTEGGPPPTPAGLADERCAANIRERREDREWSQADLARQMSERGWSFHPQTVQRIEAGHRKVSVGEAVALAEILGTSVEWLTWPGRAASTAALLSDFTGRAESSWEQISEWTRRLLHACFQLDLTTSEAEQGGYLGSAEIRRLAAAAREAMKLTPEDAVTAGRADFASLHAGDDEEPECPPRLAAEGGAQ